MDHDEGISLSVESAMNESINEFKREDTLNEAELVNQSQSNDSLDQPQHLQAHSNDTLDEHQRIEDRSNDTLDQPQVQSNDSIDQPQHLQSQRKDSPINDDSKFPNDFIFHSKVKGEPLGCIFVASLNALRSDEQLESSVTRLFKKYGPVSDIKVQRDWQGRPYAFVQYNNVENAKKALEDATDKILDSRHIRVEQARVNRTLFIAKFDKELTKEGFRDMVEVYGKADEVSLLHNFQTGKSRGCGFVKYKYREDAIRGFTGLRTEHRMVVQWAANLEKDPLNTDKNSIFVGRLNPDEVSEELLELNFSKYGEIESVEIVRNIVPRPSFAFVKFAKEESAIKAIENENGKQWLGSFIRVKIKEINVDRPGLEFDRTRTHSMSSSNGTLYQPSYNQGIPMVYHDPALYHDPGMFYPDPYIYPPYQNVPHYYQPMQPHYYYPMQYSIQPNPYYPPQMQPIFYQPQMQHNSYSLPPLPEANGSIEE